MTNLFEETYQQIQKAKNLKKNASTEEEKQIAKDQYTKAEEAIESLGQDACTIYRQYAVSRNSGNELLNIYDVLYDNQVPILVELMKEHGIKEFTFSSTWSRAIEIAWLFQENGCKLEGLIEINAQYVNYSTDEFEKIPAYLFRV